MSTQLRLKAVRKIRNAHRLGLHTCATYTKCGSWHWEYDPRFELVQRYCHDKTCGVESYENWIEQMINKGYVTP